MNRTYTRVELQREYVERIIDGMDLSDLMMIVADHFHDNLDKYTTEELETEIRDYYPDMLDDELDGE